MKIKAQFIISNLRDPLDNLSIEEDIFNNTRENDFTVFIYINSKSLIIGRNQNPWIETRPDYLRHSNIPLLRRISGGGCVFHDEGNINFSFIVGKKFYNVRRQIDSVTSILRSMSLPVKANQRNDILLNGNKISGSAYSLKRDKALHHGTLLVCSNLNLMSECLKPNLLLANTKAIESLRSDVDNLKEYSKHLTVEKMIDALTKNLCKEQGFELSTQILEKVDSQPSIQLIKEKHLSFEWLWARTPPFTYKGSYVFDHQEVEIEAEVVKGKIQSLKSLKNPPQDLAYIVGTDFHLASKN